VVQVLQSADHKNLKYYYPGLLIMKSLSLRVAFRLTEEINKMHFSYQGERFQPGSKPPFVVPQNGCNAPISFLMV